MAKRNAYRLLMGKPDGKRLLRRPRHKWVENIKMNLGEIEWGVIEWIGLHQDMNKWRALVDSVMNLQVSKNAGKFSTGYTTSGLLTIAQQYS
jgi:hypothetical protein